MRLGAALLVCLVLVGFVVGTCHAQKLLGSFDLLLANPPLDQSPSQLLVPAQLGANNFTVIVVSQGGLTAVDFASKKVAWKYRFPNGTTANYGAVPISKTLVLVPNTNSNEGYSNSTAINTTNGRVEYQVPSVSHLAVSDGKGEFFFDISDSEHLRKFHVANGNVAWNKAVRDGSLANPTLQSVNDNELLLVAPSSIGAYEVITGDYKWGGITAVTAGGLSTAFGRKSFVLAGPVLPDGLNSVISVSVIDAQSGAVTQTLPFASVSIQALVADSDAKHMYLGTENTGGMITAFDDTLVMRWSVPTPNGNAVSGIMELDGTHIVVATVGAVRLLLKTNGDVKWHYDIKTTSECQVVFVAGPVPLHNGFAVAVFEQCSTSSSTSGNVEEKVVVYGWSM